VALFIAACKLPLSDTTIQTIEYSELSKLRIYASKKNTVPESATEDDLTRYYMYTLQNMCYFLWFVIRSCVYSQLPVRYWICPEIHHKLLSIDQCWKVSITLIWIPDHIWIPGHTGIRGNERADEAAEAYGI